LKLCKSDAKYHIPYSLGDHNDVYKFKDNGVLIKLLNTHIDI